MPTMKCVLSLYKRQSFLFLLCMRIYKFSVAFLFRLKFHFNRILKSIIKTTAWFFAISFNRILPISLKYRFDFLHQRDKIKPFRKLLCFIFIWNSMMRYFVSELKFLYWSLASKFTVFVVYVEFEFGSIHI